VRLKLRHLDGILRLILALKRAKEEEKGVIIDVVS